ncbi:hypothetical protein ELI54_33760 [Rhizobium ruizarguesonis]|jgi:hypothetical protein|uniref:hypothetical protein n=1 Tax=Rhizobium ruizarguesonis TaxID=2081791 RepID=UPI0010327BE6|nr:hypothetical protein [Rhizobium ruizarguesonis]NEH75755.1 hypothetical protein [Rhizobium ruizarguesonis]NEJ85581.1 hypothetical protein [Rhizobium ruizarguesonis]TAT73536.1 hypothetical protein ELI56_27515 [Rhizobium ruizarguesonis]TAT74571.1 hypothetical protein ELI54_33760 [Rhizobium ruizarguesonis]TAZ65791.1 hypothetical protein ELH70_33000 [Rhizobium ruizarguesonis]
MGIAQRSTSAGAPSTPISATLFGNLPQHVHVTAYQLPMRSAIPLLDPVSTVIMNANSGNVDAGMVAGVFVKRDGPLVAH